MLPNNTLVELISKIRGSPFLKKYSNILEQTPRINVNFVEDKGIELYNICFNDWDEICISNTEMTFYPEHTARVGHLRTKSFSHTRIGKSFVQFLMWL